LSSNRPAAVPKDIIPDWYNVVRDAQAACAGNHGIARVTIEVVVMGNIPMVYWPRVDLVRPLSAVGNATIAPRLAEIMSAMIDKGDSPEQ
jgi:hypothetical protein